MSSNANYPPPQLPSGWIALWDEQSQRYYYVEQATGKTQWEVPTSNSTIMPSPMNFPTPNNTPQSATNYSPSPSVSFPQQSITPVSGAGGAGSGESNSYLNNNTGNYNYNNNNSGNPSPYNNNNNNTPGSSSSSAMPGGDETNEKGLGSLVSGFMKPHGHGSHGSSGFPMNAVAGGIGGAVLTLAASKLTGKHSNHGGGHGGYSSHGASGLIGNLLGGGGHSHQSGYYPPPPPPSSYGYGYGYEGGHHSHHSHHGHHSHHHGHHHH